MKQINLKHLRDLPQKAQKYSNRATTKVLPTIAKVLPTIAVVILAAGIFSLVWNTFRQQAQLTAFDQKVQQVKDVEKRLTLEKDRLTLENAINATRAQVIGGVLVFFTAFTAWRNLKIAEDKHVTDRFAKAVEQLGHVDVHVHLGAIYSLEQVANDSKQYYWPVMEILTAYVRRKSAWTKKKAEEWEAQENPEIPPLAIEIQAILTVLVRRKHSLGDGERHPLDLRKTDLRRADLRGAKMHGAWLIDTHLENADLRETHLEKANLIATHLGGAYLYRAHLEDANLSTAYLKSANLDEADLRKTKLISTHLKGARLYKVNLEDADLSTADLDSAYLSEANLKNANLTRTRLNNANLFEANLEGTILQETNFDQTYLEGANLKEVNLQGARNLLDEQLYNAKTDRNT